VIAESEPAAVTELSFRTAARSHAGPLPTNEDACTSIKTPLGAVVIVADGAGGHRFGEVASETAVREMTAVFRAASADVSVPDLIREAFAAAQRGLQQTMSGSPKYRDLRTTGLALFATRRRCWVGHVGDSRAYLIRDGVAQQLTRDDTLAQSLIEIGQLDPAAAKTYSKANVLLQALGDRTEPEYHVSDAHAMRRGDVVVLCSDGLTDVLTDAEIAECAKDGTCDAISARLLDRAIARSPRDNITVAVVEWRRSSRSPQTASARWPAARPRRRKSSNTAVLVAIAAMLALSLALVLFKRFRLRASEHRVPGVESLHPR
jgi:protein phosphatase